MRTTIVAILFALLTLGVRAQSTWTIDPVHSNVKFTVTHLVVSEVDGSFKVYSGSIQSAAPDFEGSEVEFTVDVNSINTENERRDQHLKSEDFFNATRFPQMTFKSTSWKKVSAQEYVLEGDLKIRDVSKRVAFGVLYGGTMKDGYGNTKAGFKATTVINRFDYGLQWNPLTEVGGAVVGKEVKITLNLQFAQKNPS